MQVPFILPGSGSFMSLHLYGGSGGIFIGFVFTLMAASLMKERLTSIRHYVEQKPMESLTAGLLTILIILPLVTLFFAFIPALVAIGALLWIGFIVLNAVGVACFAQLIGYHLIKRHSENPWLQLIAGYLIFAVSQYLPYLGSLVSMTVLFLGFGAVVRSRFGRPVATA